MNNIFLTGMMGSGKTTVGRLLAELKHVAFLDLDAEIETRAGMSIPEIFESRGEAAFRRWELSLTEEADFPPGGAVVATGGGFPLQEENRCWMRRHGTVVWLQVLPETVLARAGGEGRPLLQGKDRSEKVKDILNKRLIVYEKADVYISTDGKTPDEIAVEIRKKVMHEKS